MKLLLVIFAVLSLNTSNTSQRKTKEAEMEKQDAWGKTWHRAVRPKKGMRQTPIFWDFEADSAFERVPFYTNTWQWGAPTSGPGSAYSGSNCWATNLSGDYDNNADWTLTMPVQDLSTVPNPRLMFYQWYSTETSYDSGWVEVSTNGGGSWTKVSPSYRGSSAGWIKTIIDLSSYSGETNFLIRFRFTSDASVTYPGWYIDDVTVGNLSFTSHPYQSSFEPDEGDLYEVVSGAPWEWGVPTSGPGSAYSGTNCWATNLSGDYESNADWKLTMPVQNLSATANPQLMFYQWYSTETSYDSGWVEVSTNGGSSWTKVSPSYRGSSGAWIKESVDLSSYSGEGSVLIRFRFMSDGSVTYPGWYIDDVRVADLSLTSHPYQSSFESDDGDLSEVLIGGGSTAPWEWGAPTSGPGSAYDGTNCWATNLSGNYNIDVDAAIRNGTNLDLQSASYGEMNFYHWFDTETSFDSGWVEISTNGQNGPWTTVSDAFRGSSGGWIETNLDISSYTNTNKFRFQFRFKSDGSVVYSGWYVDSVRVSLGSISTLNFYDFEADDGGFIPDPADLCEWHWGIPTSGPGSAYNGTKCWATNLSGDYSNNADAYLMNGTDLDLQSAACAEINFYHWYDTETSYDSGWVEVSTNSGSSWTKVSPSYHGSSGGWLVGNCDLSAFTNTNQFRFQFRFKSNASTVYSGWYVDSVRVSIGTISPVNFYDFEADSGDFVPDPPTTDLNEWHCGTPSSGPGSAYSGVNCWATDLDGDYENNANWILMTPICDLTGWTIASLQLANWYSTEDGPDYCTIEASSDSGSTWSTLKSYTGSSGGWVAETIDVTPFISDGFRARFIFTSDAANVNPGWYIDDVKIDTVGGYILYDPIKVATNWIAMYVSNDATDDPGTYTCATEPAHTYGADITMLYGGGAHNPWSSYTTVRSYRTNTDYVMRSTGATTEAGFTVGQLSDYYRGAKFLKGQRLQQDWSVQNGQDDFEIRQIINADASDDSSRLGVILILKNLDNQNQDFSFRYEWDVHVGSEDSPWYRWFEWSIPNPWEPYEIKWTDFSDVWYGEECEDGVGMRHFLSITQPAYYNPPPTVPDTLFYVRWAGTYGANSNAFQIPYMGDGIADSLCGDWDAAVCYMWVNRTIASNDSIILAQYIFSPIDSIIIGTEELPTAQVYNHPVLRFANPIKKGGQMILNGPKTKEIQIDLYSVDGRLVKRIFDGTLKTESINLKFDGIDDVGRTLSNGTYFIFLKTEDSKHTQKVIYLK